LTHGTKFFPFFQTTDHLPSTEVQAEYFVDQTRSVEILRSMAETLQQFPHLTEILPNGGSEIRVVSSDTLWMSPCYNQHCLAIHFTMSHVPHHFRLVEEVGKMLDGFDGRPHWGKLFKTKMEKIRELYKENVEKFGRLCLDHDPNGKFQNEFLQALLFPK